MIDAFRNAHPEATPWDLYILIATDHPRGTYARELAKRKADQTGASWNPLIGWLRRIEGLRRVLSS